MAARKRTLNRPAPRARASKWLIGIPEWEAVKGAYSNKSPHKAVLECDFLRNQYRTMTSDMANVRVEVREILQALRAKKVPFVLTGTHGIGVWTGRPRATYDVDLLVKAGRNHARAVKAIQALYPQLECRRFTGLTSFFVPGEVESIIDVSCPQRPDNEETLRTPVWVEEEGLAYRIPSLENALANKYGAMLTLTREPDKRVQDGLDFFRMVRHSTEQGRQAIDLELLAVLGELVWPGGGGHEILRFVEQAKSGIVPSFLPTRPGQP